MKLSDRQNLLETEDASKRLERLHERDAGRDRDPPGGEEEDPRSRVKKQMEKTQKEYYLERAECRRSRRSWVAASGTSSRTRISRKIEEQLKTKRMSKEATAKVKKELKKLKLMHPTSAGGDGGAQLHRLDPGALLVRRKSEETHDLQGGRGHPRRGSLRATPHPKMERISSTSCGAGAHEESSRARSSASSARPAWGSTSLCKEHRAGDGAKVRPALSLGGGVRR